MTIPRAGNYAPWVPCSTGREVITPIRTLQMDTGFSANVREVTYKNFRSIFAPCNTTLHEQGMIDTVSADTPVIRKDLTVFFKITHAEERRLQQTGLA
jgi:hypothetical protein